MKAIFETVMLKHSCGKIERKMVNAFESVRSFENLKKYKKLIMSCMKVIAYIMIDLLDYLFLIL